MSMLQIWMPNPSRQSVVSDFLSAAMDLSFNCFNRGGSSSVNAMMYVCGQDRDYDRWNASGATGWDYQSLLQYFKIHENNTDTSKSSDNHGFSGPLTVSTYGRNDKFFDVLAAGFAQLGYNNLSDYEPGQYNGYTDVQGTVRNGERCSSYQAYISRTYRNRSNLHIYTNSNVTKILFSGTTATGVNIKTNCSDCVNIVLKATKEVIVTAGALGTPKLLQLSGVGKRADLTPIGITQVGADLPVGENLQDHFYAINWFTLNPDGKNQSLIDLLADTNMYSANRTGNLSSSGLNFGAFIDTVNGVNGTYADIQYIPYHFPKNQQEFATVLANFGYKDEFISVLLQLNAQYELLVIFTILLQPVACGTAKIRSIDPLVLPKIVTNFVTNDIDVNATIRGITRLVDLVNTPAFVNVSAQIVKFSLPECDSITDSPSYAYWNCYIKYLSGSNWHPTGTCKMGAASDPTAVVDPFLKVRGFSKLRVADGSIFPFIPSGNTQCPIYATAEKAAAMIKSSY